MNLYETQDFFEKINPGKAITFDFDDKCIRQIECIYTDGKLHPVNHVEYQQVRVTVEGSDPIYVPIQPHRACIDCHCLKEKIARDELHFTEVQEKE